MPTESRFDSDSLPQGKFWERKDLGIGDRYVKSFFGVDKNLSIRKVFAELFLKSDLPRNTPTNQNLKLQSASCKFGEIVIK